MLPSRLFRNTGLAPPLRSLITPHASLPASISVQLRLRLGVGAAHYSSSLGDASQASEQSKSSGSSSIKPEVSSPSLQAPPASSQSTGVASATQRLKTDPLEPRLSITFTCTAPGCSTRSSHTFTKRAYEKGVVLVECPGCKNRHLIADHLSWFKDSTDGGRLRTVEDLVKARGEKVMRGEMKVGEGGEGVLEFSE